MGVYTVKSVWIKKPLDQGEPTPELFEIKESQINDEDLKDNEVLVQNLVMSVDPYLRWRIKSDAFQAKEDGKMAMEGFVAGKILKSKNSHWKEGDLFGAMMPFATYAIIKPHLIWNLSKYLKEDEIEKGVGVLGMVGATAYGGVVDVLRPEKGQIIFCSAASGAVGSLVAQIAKIQGAEIAIGSCGGDVKGQVIKKDFKYDDFIDYKKVSTADALEKELKKCAPDGIDMYFENVGGYHFDAAFRSLRQGGRIAVCGAISGYNEKETPANKITLGNMIYTQQRIEGFISSDWLSGKRNGDKWLKDMSKWMKEGKLKSQETIVHGIEKWPESFCSLFTSGSSHLGKLCVKI